LKATEVDTVPASTQAKSALTGATNNALQHYCVHFYIFFILYTWGQLNSNMVSRLQFTFTLKLDGRLRKTLKHRNTITKYNMSSTSTQIKRKTKDKVTHK